MNRKDAQRNIACVVKDHQLQNMIDKRDRAVQFRIRLARAMAESGQSQSALARATGVDRSTISALLGAGTRLPNAQLAADCAAALGVSCDWLLGLAGRPEPVDDVLAASVSMTEAPRALFDDVMFGWHKDAAGYKIRHVPATLPDMLKTAAVVKWEYRDAFGHSAKQALTAFEAQMEWMRGARSDYEIAIPLHGLADFAAGTGYWAGLPVAARLDQLDHLTRLSEQLYPSLRLYLFDAHRVFSSPVTVFGPHLAAIYLGRHYIAFRDPSRVASISQHFDWLLREAVCSARDIPDHLRRLRASVSDTA